MHARSPCVKGLPRASRKRSQINRNLRALYESNAQEDLWLKIRNAPIRDAAAKQGRAVITAARIARGPEKRPKFNAVAGILNAHSRVSPDLRSNDLRPD